MRQLVVVAACLFAFCSCRRSEKLLDEKQRFAALNDASAFSLAEVSEGIHRLVVNFYAPDCPPCENEVPALRSFYEKYRNDKTLRFVSIGSNLRAIEQTPNSGKDPPLDYTQIRAELSLFAKKFSLAWPQFAADGAALKSWRVTGFPETFIFTRQSKSLILQRKFISEISLDTLERELYGTQR